MKFLLDKSRKVQAAFIAGIAVAILLISAAVIPYSYAQNLISHSLGKGHLCGAYGVPTYVVDAKGFSHVTQFYGNRSGLFEFVIPPNDNSTGYITMAYDYSSMGQPVFLPPGLVPSSSQHVLGDVFHTNIPQYFGMIDVWKLIEYNSTIPGSASNDLIPVPYAKKDVGLDVHVSNITNVTSSIVKVTYAVHADHSAERGTYLLNLKICPGELVTVGDKPHKGHFHGIQGKEVLSHR